MSELVLVQRVVCSLQFVQSSEVEYLPFLSTMRCKDGKRFIKSSSPRDTMDGKYNGWLNLDPKNILNTLQHWALFSKLPFNKNECGVQVQNRKAWDRHLAPARWGGCGLATRCRLS